MIKKGCEIEIGELGRCVRRSKRREVGVRGNDCVWIAGVYAGLVREFDIGW